MVKKYDLLQKGLFPETLPPCFVSNDMKRALVGLVSSLDNKKFWNGRSTNYSRFAGTKHDGNRRPYATPNPISYYNVCSFIDGNWRAFSKRFDVSPYSVSIPRVGESSDERAVIVPSLSELAEKVSLKIGHSPFILKADISQYFPSIYTHSIPWSAHGIEEAKADRDRKSKKIKFNALDFFVQNTQRGQTRGVLIGPDAFRLIAEFIACDIDMRLSERAGGLIVGAVRHVDDFYIGVTSEVNALAVLSHLREVLQTYELQVNDAKTKIISGLEPIDDVWAQYLRSMPFRGYSVDRVPDIFHILDKAFETSNNIRSESPMKIAIRRIDKERIYIGDIWRSIEPRLQRIIYHFPHVIDYIALVVAKRYAIGLDIDKAGWSKAINDVIMRSHSLNHHHEVVWLLWLLIICRIGASDQLVDALVRTDNAYVRSMLIQAYVEGRIEKRPRVPMNKMETTDDLWLQNIVARSSGFSQAHFQGNLKDEFEHLASKKVRLINFDPHLNLVKSSKVAAISKSRYGYDSDSNEDCDLDDDSGI